MKWCASWGDLWNSTSQGAWNIIGDRFLRKWGKLSQFIRIFPKMRRMHGWKEFLDRYSGDRMWHPGAGTLLSGLGPFIHRVSLYRFGSVGYQDRIHWDYWGELKTAAGDAPPLPFPETVLRPPQSRPAHQRSLTEPNSGLTRMEQNLEVPRMPELVCAWSTEQQEVCDNDQGENSRQLKPRTRLPSQFLFSKHALVICYVSIKYLHFCIVLELQLCLINNLQCELCLLDLYISTVSSCVSLWLP